MDRLKACFRHSLTILVARVGAASSGLFYVAYQAADILSLPEFKSQLGGLVPPKAVGLIGLGAFIVVELARRRTLPPAGGGKGTS